MEYDDSDGGTIKDCKMIEVTLSGSHCLVNSDVFDILFHSCMTLPYKIHVPLIIKIFLSVKFDLFIWYVF